MLKPEKTISRMKKGNPVTLAALGDSLTQGWMVRKGYADFLVDNLQGAYPSSEITLINRGIPGDTADGGLRRLRNHVIDLNPDCILIQFALNDAFLGYTPDEYRRNIEEIVDDIEANTESEIVIVTSVPVMLERENKIAENFYQKLHDVSSERNLPIAMVHEYWKTAVSQGTDHRSLIQGDMVHPNLEGHRIMAEAVTRVFL